MQHIIIIFPSNYTLYIKILIVKNYNFCYKFIQFYMTFTWNYNNFPRIISLKNNLGNAFYKRLLYDIFELIFVETFPPFSYKSHRVYIHQSSSFIVDKKCRTTYLAIRLTLVIANEFLAQIQYFNIESRAKRAFFFSSFAFSNPAVLAYVSSTSREQKARDDGAFFLFFPLQAGSHRR